MNCYRCNKPITEKNHSEEHIIPNACGGRLVSYQLLCNDCNSKLGERYDNALATSTNYLVNLLLIKRHRGEAQPIKTKRSETGETYFLELGAYPFNPIPEIIEETENGNLKIKIKASKTKILNKTIKGILRKYPQLNKEEFIQNVKNEDQYIDDTFEIKSNIGGTDEFKSICKTAINFYIFKGGERIYIKHLIDLFDTDCELENVWMFYPEKQVYEYSNDEITHVIKVVGDPKHQILYAYVELFNYQCFIVELNNNYQGNHFDYDYIYNLHTYEVKEKQTDLFLSRNELSNILSNRSFFPVDKIQKRHSHIMKISNNLLNKLHVENMISEAVDNTMKRYPDKSGLTPEMQIESKEEFLEMYLKYLIHLYNVKKK